MEENTKIIKASEKGYTKLYKNTSVSDYKKSIQDENLLTNSKSIELDITSCRLGYPATPQFVDLFLEHLAKMDGEKSLIIKMGCISYSEWVCLNVIVLEGEFFGIMEKMDSNEDLARVKEVVNKKLTENGIVMTIILDDTTQKPFEYGKYC